MAYKKEIGLVTNDFLLAKSLKEKIDFIKILSQDFLDVKLIKNFYLLKLPLYLSVGFSSSKQINVVLNALKKNWDPALIPYYGKLKSEHTNKQIDRAESWLKKYPNNPQLLLCLGRLCIQQKLWGKAQDYLNSALDIAAVPEVYFEFGRLFEATDNPKAALESYRKAFH